MTLSNNAHEHSKLNELFFIFNTTLDKLYMLNDNMFSTSHAHKKDLEKIKYLIENSDDDATKKEKLLHTVKLFKILVDEGEMIDAFMTLAPEYSKELLDVKAFGALFIYKAEKL